MSHSPVVEVQDLTYSHRRGRPLFSGVSMSIPSGRVVLLGPNGAGKSTLMRLISGALRPRSGQIVFNTSATGAGRPAALMPQDIAPIPGLRCHEQVAYHAWLQGISPSRTGAAADRALAKVGLQDLSNRRVDELSGGELRRVGLAQAWATTPPVLLLDEPTAGLDPSHRRGVRRLLKTLGAATQCCVVSTHLVDDLEDTYDHVIVLAQGMVRFQGSIPEFLALSPGGAEACYEAAVLRNEP